MLDSGAVAGMAQPALRDEAAGVADDERRRAERDGGHAGVPNPSPSHGAAHVTHRKRRDQGPAQPCRWPTASTPRRAPGRPRLPIHHDRAARTMARMLASGALAGLAQQLPVSRHAARHTPFPPPART